MPPVVAYHGSCTLLCGLRQDCYPKEKFGLFTINEYPEVNRVHINQARRICGAAAPRCWLATTTSLGQSWSRHQNVDRLGSDQQ